MITVGSSARAAAAARSFAHIASVVTSDLARQMAAALGQLLVFQLNRRRAGPLQLGDRPLDVHRVAEAGVGIDDHRNRHPRRQIVAPAAPARSA